MISNESSKTARPKTRSRHPNPTTDKRKSAFHRQSSIFLSMLVDWDIPFDQLDMDESKPLSGGRFGTKCYIGKWHGECNIRKVLFYEVLRGFVWFQLRVIPKTFLKQ